MSFAEGFAGGLVTGTKIKAAKASKAKADAALVPTGGATGGSVPAEPSPMEQAKTWLKDKLGGLTGDAASGVTKGGDDVGLMERLKAGNIDDPKSEAYARWGKGSGAGVQSTGDASQVSDPEALGPGGTFTSAMWNEAPEFGSGANPAWDDLNKNMES